VERGKDAELLMLRHEVAAQHRALLAGLVRMLTLGCRQLRAVLAEYVEHYNGYRLHRALEQAAPLGSGEPSVALLGGRVARRDRLGGLIHEYEPAA